jgi:hypothetical protein
MARRFLLCAFLLLPAFPQSLSQGERDRALSSLHGARKMILDATTGLSPAQWNFKAGLDRWSIAEVAEHIAGSEDFIFALVEKIAGSPPANLNRAEQRKKDDLIINGVPKRDQKFQAPEQLRPKGLYKSPAEFARAFVKSRDRNIAFVRDTQADLRGVAADHPALGPLDAYQWMLFISAHSERHLNQIREVMETPGFPKK